MIIVVLFNPGHSMFVWPNFSVFENYVSAGQVSITGCIHISVVLSKCFIICHSAGCMLTILTKIICITQVIWVGNTFCSVSHHLNFTKKLFECSRQFNTNMDITYAFKNGSEYADPKNIWKLIVESLLSRQLCFTVHMLMSEVDYQLLVVIIGTRSLTAFIIPMNLVAWQSRWD